MRWNAGVPPGDAVTFVATNLVLPASFSIAIGTCCSLYSFSNCSMSVGRLSRLKECPSTRLDRERPAAFGPLPQPLLIVEARKKKLGQRLCGMAFSVHGPVGACATLWR